MLTTHIEQDVEPGQTAGEGNGVAARVVDAVGEEQGTSVGRAGSGQLFLRQFEREADVGESSSRKSEQGLHEVRRFDPLTEGEQQCRVGPKGDDGQLIVFHLSSQGTDSGGGRS